MKLSVGFTIRAATVFGFGGMQRIGVAGGRGFLDSMDWCRLKERTAKGCNTTIEATGYRGVPNV